MEIIKGGIDSFEPKNKEEENIKDLMLVAFSAILIDCSNLKRTPCLGYSKRKRVDEGAPLRLYKRKINEIAHDLKVLQKSYGKNDTASKTHLANSKDYQHNTSYDLVLTSPPYMNGLDYVINYKIEMGWLGFAENHNQLKKSRILWSCVTTFLKD